MEYAYDLLRIGVSDYLINAYEYFDGNDGNKEKGRRGKVFHVYLGANVTTIIETPNKEPITTQKPP